MFFCKKKLIVVNNRKVMIISLHYEDYVYFTDPLQGTTVNLNYIWQFRLLNV